MRQLQLHEYLALLEGGVRTEPASAAVSEACLQDAQRIWPELNLAAWADCDRRIEYSARCEATGTLLVHVGADWANCFLILAVPSGNVQPEGFLLFDIGAEYQEAKFTCPAFGLDQAADEESIRKYVPLLPGEDDPFAVLETGDGTYMQAWAEDGLFDVEHQLVSTSSHYCLEQKVGAGTVVDLFLSYAFGMKEWAKEFTWTKVRL